MASLGNTALEEVTETVYITFKNMYFISLLVS